VSWNAAYIAVKPARVRVHWGVVFWDIGCVRPIIYRLRARRDRKVKTHAAGAIFLVSKLLVTMS